MNHRDDPISGSHESPTNDFHSDQSDESYGVGFIVGLSATIALIVICFFVMSFLCILSIRNRQASSNKSKDEEAALDDSALNIWLKIKYGEAKNQLPAGREAASACCSVCLADFVDHDELRLLRHCSHLFHAHCVDPWLQKQPTCPLCRTAVTPAT